MPLIHKNLTGLTGAKQQIAAAAKACRVCHAKSGDDAAYEVDHSSIIYFMDPYGQYAAHLAYGVDAEKIARKVRDVMAKR